MRRKEGEELPPAVTPCEAFEMSDRFKAWVMAQMKDHVQEQVREAGLDRMAIVRQGKDAGAPATQAAPGR